MISPVPLFQCMSKHVRVTSLHVTYVQLDSIASKNYKINGVNSTLQKCHSGEIQLDSGVNQLANQMRSELIREILINFVLDLMIILSVQYKS